MTPSGMELDPDRMRRAYARVPPETSPLAPVFRSCTEPLGGEIDLDAFTRYLGAHSPLAPPTLNRIDKVG
jgi:hypothetical protein